MAKRKPLQVEVHDVVATPRTVEMPLRCPDAACNAKLAKVGVNEVCLLDVGMFHTVGKEELEPEGDQKFGDHHTVIGFECGACGKVVVGTNGPRVAR
jgi:hypothetical protein